MKKQKTRLTLIALALASLSGNAISDDSMPWGRVQGFGSGVTNNVGIAGGDLMLPYGSKDSFVFGDVMGSYGDAGTYTVSPGVGYRKVIKNQILGAYFFGDYEKTNLGANFWNLSPGIEWMNPTWDAHINGYFPTSTTKQIGNVTFASNLGDESYTTHETGTHNEYDALVAPYAVIGNGVDTAIGYSFDMNDNHLRSRVYLGGYYYQQPADTNVQNITGVTAGFTQALNKNLSITLFNSYDQVSDYNVGVSVSLTFGGESNVMSNDVHDRLMDPVMRHVGVIDTAAANYDQEYNEVVGTGLHYDNVYFVSPDGTGDGTYGNPMALSQNSLDTVNTEMPDASRIYLQEGNYTLDSTLTVYSNQDFYGRTEDYSATAASDAQPVISFDSGNEFMIESGENTFSDLTMTGFGSYSAFYIENSSDNETMLTLNNVNVSGFSIGLMAINHGNGTMMFDIDNSTFNNNASAGMNVVNSGSGDLEFSAVNSQFNDNGITNNDLNTAVGLYIINSGEGDADIELLNSQFNGNGQASASDINIGTSNSVSGAFISNTSSGTINLNIIGSTFNKNGLDNGYNNVNIWGINGLALNNTNTGVINASIKDSEFNFNGIISGEGDDIVGADGLYIRNEGLGSVNLAVDSSTFSGNGNTAKSTTVDVDSAAGIAVDNNGNGNITMSITNSILGANGLTAIGQDTSGIDAGLYLNNTALGNISVTSLEGTTIVANGNDGIYASSTAGGNINIDKTGLIFSYQPNHIITQGDVTFIPYTL